MSMDSIIEVFPKLRLYLWSDTHISITWLGLPYYIALSIGPAKNCQNHCPIP